MSSHERAISPVDELRLLRAAACDPRLCRGDVAVFAVILQHQNFEGVAFPGKNRLGKLAGLAPRNVQARISRLEETGYVVVERRGQRLVNRYTVCRRIEAATGDAHIPRLDQTTGDAGIPSEVEAGEASGDAGISPSGDARIHHLVMPASPELTTNSQSELAIAPSGARKPGKVKGITMREWLDSAAPDMDLIPNGHRVNSYATEAGIPDEFMQLAWVAFMDRYESRPKRYSDWPRAFLDHIKAGWLNIWRIDAGTQQYVLTTPGLQLQRQQQALDKAA